MEQEPHRKEERWSMNHREKSKDGAGTTEKRGKMEQEPQRKEERWCLARDWE